MAVYHLSMKSGSRASGQSAAAHGAYIAREGKYAPKPKKDQDRTTEQADQPDERRAVLVEHGNLPEFANGDPHAFWKAADDHERANGRLWSEIEVSLPRELSRDDQIALAREFRDAMIGDRHAYSLAIHVPKTLDGNSENPHIHLMFCERVIDDRTRVFDENLYFKRNGAMKDRSWSDQDKVEEVRQAWETMANRALDKAGFDVRIDRRSLAAQGIRRIAEPKMGNAAREVEWFLRSVNTTTPVAMEELGERAQAALSVRSVRALEAQRGAVVIELAKVREERAAKEQARVEHRQRLLALPLDQLRQVTQGLQPAAAVAGRPAWERDWNQLSEVVRANAEATVALDGVTYTEADINAITKRQQHLTQAEQDYRKVHWIKAAGHAVSSVVGFFKDDQLNAFSSEQTYLAQQLTREQQRLARTQTEQQAADETWQRVVSDPMLQAQAREIYGDNVARWEDAKQILEKRVAERNHAEALVQQLLAAQRLGVKFDRGRVPEDVRGVLGYFDEGQKLGSHALKQRDAEVVMLLASNPEARRGMERALAPQKQIIDLELQRGLDRGRGR